MKGSGIFEQDVQVLCNTTPEQYLKQLTTQAGQDEPFFVFNAGDVIQKVKNWRLKMPRVKMFYAVKCNDAQPVLEVLSTLGTGFDCASKGEFEKVLKHGIDPTRIIYAHPCKPYSHLKAASNHGIKRMTFDNESELHKVKKLMPQAHLVLRIRCDATKVQCPLGSKFGAAPADARKLLESAHNLGLKVIGVSFHVGSGCQEPQVFTRAIRVSREVFDIAKEIGFNPYLLDIGGGYPGESNSSIDACAHYINEAIDLHFPEDSGVEIIAEPGRYVVASAFLSATHVISKRDTKNADDQVVSTMYYVNDGVYGSFNCILYDHQVVNPSLTKEYSGPLVQSSIWGPTCDGIDILIEKMDLPQLEIGDWLMWKDMGAYTLAAAGTFNGFPVPKIHTAIPHHNWLLLESIVKGETDFQHDWCVVPDRDVIKPRVRTSSTSCAEDCDQTEIPRDHQFAIFSPAN